jgi:hypothetical protein
MLKTKLKHSTSHVNQTPIFFRLSKQADQKRLSALFKTGKVSSVIDKYLDQEQEFFAVCNPNLVFDKLFNKKFKIYLKNKREGSPEWKLGTWVFFPWLNTLVHTLEEEAFQRVRTARNMNLITSEEQKKFYNSTIGIVGLSVGNNVALTIALQGGAKRLRLADFDTLSLSNTNRVRAGIQNLGLPKVELTARQIYEINPYADIELFPEGITLSNIESFFNGKQKLDIIIDEADNIAIKFLLRKYAKKYKLPVVMGADNGDGAVIDIERYDQKPNQKFFDGRLGNISYKKLLGLDKFGIGRTIVKHIGLKNLTTRTIESVLEMGRTLVSWPQLGSAAVLNGSALSYCVRRILNGQSAVTNRVLISFESSLGTSDLQKVKRDEAIKKFKSILG